eukprot:scaffold565096_cov13-Prasinocladus_malaysianus.AAC.1
MLRRFNVFASGRVDDNGYETVSRMHGQVRRQLNWKPSECCTNSETTVYLSTNDQAPASRTRLCRHVFLSNSWPLRIHQVPRARSYSMHGLGWHTRRARTGRNHAFRPNDYERQTTPDM